MNRFEMSVQIHRPVDEVWALITDIPRYSMALWGERWRLPSHVPLGLDSRLHDEAGAPIRVVQFVPTQRFAVEMKSQRRTLRRGSAGHALEAIPNGTSVTTWIELEFASWAQLLRPVLLAYFQTDFREGVAGLTRYLEGGGAAFSMPEGEERVATPARYNNLVAAGAGAVTWVSLLLFSGPMFALQTVWILLLAAFVLAYTVVPRLRFSRSRLRRTFGPWSREVDLSQLESIRWKNNTYGYGAQGTMYVRDRSGHRVAIQVGAFKRGEEWGPLLLQAAKASGAKLDTESREILEHQV